MKKLTSSVNKGRKYSLSRSKGSRVNDSKSQRKLDKLRKSHLSGKVKKALNLSQFIKKIKDMSYQTRDKIKTILDKTGSKPVQKDAKSSNKKLRKTCIFFSTSKKNSYLDVSNTEALPSTLPFKTSDTYKGDIVNIEKNSIDSTRKYFKSLKQILTKTSINYRKKLDDVNLFHLSQNTNFFNSQRGNSSSKICDFLKKNDTWTKIESMKGKSRGVINLETGICDRLFWRTRSGSQKPESKENMPKYKSPKRSLRNSFFKPISIKRKDFFKRKILRERMKNVKNDCSTLAKNVDFTK